MAEAKKQYPYQGKTVDGEEIAFETDGEQWTQYQLADGTKLKVKLVMMDVVRLAEVDENGVPVYLFTAQQIVGVEPNPALIQPKKDKVQ
jgi:hypothetical protein